MYESGINKIKKSCLSKELKDFLLDSYKKLEELEEKIETLKSKEMCNQVEINKLEKQYNELEYKVRKIYLS
jgi:hypothetical protein